jgi:2C-methyl-D-erythritol 2,4-cyclodiphosphate synthase
MEARVAEAVLAGQAHVSIKAKTNEGMGWIGRGEGIAVLAVATLSESSGPRLSGGSSGILG